LEVLGHYVEPTGLWNLLEEIPRRQSIIPMEYSTGIDWSCGALLPLESVLLEPPNQCLDLEGLIGPAFRIDAVESNGISTELYGRFPIQLLPAILMEGPACQIGAASGTESMSWRALDPPQLMCIDLWALKIDPDGSPVGVL